MIGSILAIVWLCCLGFFLTKIIPKYLAYLALKKVPGPDCGFWIGKFITVFREPFMTPHKGWWKDVGYDAPVVRYSKIMGDNMVLVFDPEIIREILTSPASKDDCRFYKPYGSGPMVFVLGRGLVTLDGDVWMRHRKLIQPAFSVPFLKEAIEECVPNKVAEFLQYWIDAGEGQEIDCGIHLSALTLDVIGEAAFSYDCHGLADIASWSKKAAAAKQQQQQQQQANKESTISPELTDPLITSMNAMLKPNMFQICLYIFGLGVLDPILNSTSARVGAALNATIDGIITNAKEKDDNQNNSNRNNNNNGSSSSSSSPSKKAKTKSILQLLLSAKDDPETTTTTTTTTTTKQPALLNDLELRDEVKTFLFAGHETTSTWCAWAMFALAKHPDVQEKLYQDVMKHAPSSSGGGGSSDSISSNITLDQADSMEYLAAFLQETLRMYSPVGMMIRKNRYQEKIACYSIPPGTSFGIPTHLIHRHPKYWDDPDAFKPERWHKSKSLNSGIDNRAFTFLPFGAGGHNCIGYRFAQYEAKLIMAHMVRALRIGIAPSQRDVEHTFSTAVTMKAKPGIKVVVKPRKAE